MPIQSAPIGGGAVVQGMGVSGVSSVEACGNGNLSVNRLNSSTNGGALVYMQCLDSAGAKVAPALNSVVVGSIYLSNSSVTVNGL